MPESDDRPRMREAGRARRCLTVAGITVVIVATLLTVLAGLQLVRERWCRAERTRRLQSVRVPIPPGAEGVSRGVDSDGTVLVIEYQVAVSQDPNEVLQFYDRELVPQGWVISRSYPALGGERIWKEFITPRQAASGLGYGRTSQGRLLDATYVHERSDLTLRLLLIEKTAAGVMRVSVNVWPVAQPEVPL